jgi:hypothetical protein
MPTDLDAATAARKRAAQAETQTLVTIKPTLKRRVTREPGSAEKWTAWTVSKLFSIT